ncbi:HAD-IIIA family hydrolase [Streptomyces olivoreticuli]
MRGRARSVRPIPVHLPEQTTENEQDPNVKKSGEEVRPRKEQHPKPPDAFFLDRDGTLNVKPPPGEYVVSPAELTLLPGAAAAVRRINESERPAILVTNQRGVARGIMSEGDLAAVQRRLAELLRAEGAFLDACYSCVHDEGGCDCRKPRPGLLTRAAADFPGLALPDAVMIGDAETDVLAGRAAGTATVRLAAEARGSAADLVAADLWTAVDLLLKGGW